VRLIVSLLLALLVAGGCDRQKPAAPQAADPTQPVKGVDRSHKGGPAPDTVFKDPDGGTIDLDEFRGAPVLVNLWASWCAPCVKELPTLDRLAASHEADGDLGVIAVSQDMAPQSSVRAFLAKLKVERLGAYHDPDMGLTAAIPAPVLPTTVLYDSEGREVWRYVGDLDWTGEEAAGLLAEAEASPSGSR